MAIIHLTSRTRHNYWLMSLGLSLMTQLLARVTWPLAHDTITGMCVTWPLAQDNY
jgi:hypothetical protein